MMDNTEQKQPQPQKELTKKEKFIAMLKETVETVVFVIVMVVIIRFFIGEIRWIPSASMRPTLIEGDRILLKGFPVFILLQKEAILWSFIRLKKI